MSIDLADYERKTREAIKAFWGNREAARQKQIESGRVDQGERAGVTSGKNMDGFLSLVKDIVHLNGLGHAQICLERRALTLPGYFRPTKLWDMLVLNEGRLIAAVEFKSQVGPSFGNNFNNRTEEAIGTAVDLATAYREGALGDQPRPFTGWVMLLEDCESSRASVRDASPHFSVFPEFAGASYAERYNILCRKLVQEQLYTTASLLLSPRTAVDTGDYRELSELTGLRTFVTSLAGHVAAEAARSGTDHAAREPSDRFGGSQGAGLEGRRLLLWLVAEIRSSGHRSWDVQLLVREEGLGQHGRQVSGVTSCGKPPWYVERMPGGVGGGDSREPLLPDCSPRL